MAEKEKKTITPKKKTTSRKTTATANRKPTKKAKTTEEIEKLEKALDKVSKQDVIDLVPEEIKEDVKKDKEAAEKYENPQSVDFESEVKKIIETVEPSEEIKTQIAEFEANKDRLDKALEKEPEKAAEILQDGISKIEAIRKKTEAIRASLQEGNTKNETFTNWWNGMNNGF